MSDNASLKVRVRLYCGTEIALGPGKADLLAAIGTHGSISAAARALGMSYRRAWLLVDTMNRSWNEPLVETFPGVARGRGARVSPFGAEVLRCYQALQRQLDEVAATSQLAGLAAAIRPAGAGEAGEVAGSG